MQSIITHVLEAHRAVEAEMAGPTQRGKTTSTGWDSL